MSTRSLDPTATLSLLQYEPFVRAVVRGLVHGEDAVDEIVQNTWLSALRRPPVGVGSLKGWLSTVARNKAHDYHRSRGRRADHERELVDEPLAQRDEQELEAHRHVVNAVLDLDEPYKSVVLLAYYKELSPALIAKQLGRKPATVRSQLHRAHELLRSKLDASYGGQRSVWMAVFAPYLRPDGGAGSLAASAVVGSAAKLAAAVLFVTATALFVDGWFEDTEPGTAGLAAGEVAASAEERAAASPRTATPVASASPSVKGPALPVVEATGAPRRAPAANEVANTTAVPLLVEVLGPDGELLEGAPVQLLFRVEEHDTRGVLHRFHTDAQGLAKVPHLPALLEAFAWEEDTQVKYYVQAGVPAASPAPVRIDPNSDRARTVRIALGVTAPLEVRTLDAGGRPRALGGYVTVGVANDLGADEPQVQAELRNGIASIPYVGLNRQLQVDVRAPDAGVHWQAFGQGPARADEFAIIEVYDPIRPVVLGRALDASGDALGHQQLQLNLWNHKQTWGPTYARTDATGNFRVEVDKRFPAGRSARATLVHGSLSGAMLRADVPDQTLILAGERDLGAITFGRIESELAGVCVDAEGEPLAGVDVSAPYIFPTRSFGDTTDAHGRFRLRGPFALGVQLNVRSETLVVANTEPLRLGKENVVVLAEGGRLRGRVFAAEGVDLTQLSVILTDASISQPKRTDYTRWVQVQADGTFEAKGLPTACYDCKLRLPASEVLVVEDVGAELGTTNADPRLQIDLGGLLHTVSFDIRTATGESASNARAQVYRAGELVTYANPNRGRLELVYTRPEQSTLVVLAADHVPAILPGAHAGGRLELERGIEIRLRTAARPPLEHGRMEAYLHLRPLAETDLPEALFDVAVPAALAETGETRMRVPATGRYRLHVRKQEQFRGNRAALVSAGEPEPLDAFLNVNSERDGVVYDLDLPESLFD